MTTEQFIAAKAVEAVKAIYGADVPAELMQVQVTRKDFEGDYTLVVFPLLRTSRQAPAVTAQAIGEWLTANCPEFSGFNAVQGFLNLSLSNVYWRENLQDIIADKAFGQLPSTGRRVMVEFSSPNTNKPLHLGHIRNNLLGSSVSDWSMKSSRAALPLPWTTLKSLFRPALFLIISRRILRLMPDRRSASS